MFGQPTRTMMPVARHPSLTRTVTMARHPPATRTMARQPQLRVRVGPRWPEPDARRGTAHPSPEGPLNFRARAADSDFRVPICQCRPRAGHRAHHLHRDAVTRMIQVLAGGGTGLGATLACKWTLTMSHEGRGPSSETADSEHCGELRSGVEDDPRREGSSQPVLQLSESTVTHSSVT